MKKRLENWWFFKSRFLLIVAMIGVIVCVVILSTHDNTLTKEENYVATEQTMDTQKIHDYNDEFDEGGDIEIKVNGQLLESDDQFKSLQRDNRIFSVIFVFIIVCALIVFVAITLLYLIIKFIIKM